MVKHTQTICRLLPTNCLSVFDHFVKLALKGLKFVNQNFLPFEIKYFGKNASMYFNGVFIYNNFNIRRSTFEIAGFYIPNEFIRAVAESVEGTKEKV